MPISCGWMGLLILKEEFNDAKFLHVSTDEVYGTLGQKACLPKKLLMHQTAHTRHQKLLQIFL